MKKMKYFAPELELWEMVPATEIAELSNPLDEPSEEDTEGWDDEW